MKVHFLLVMIMTSLFISCGDNSSGDSKSSSRTNTGTLLVSNGNTSSQCQGLNGALILYKNRYYQIDQSNQNLINTIYTLMSQTYYGGGTSSSYNTGYNNNYYQNYSIIGSDQCSNHYRIDFRGSSSNQNNYNGYGSYNQQNLIMTISSFNIR